MEDNKKLISLWITPLGGGDRLQCRQHGFWGSIDAAGTGGLPSTPAPWERDRRHPSATGRGALSMPPAQGGIDINASAMGREALSMPTAQGGGPVDVGARGREPCQCRRHRGINVNASAAGRGALSMPMAQGGCPQRQRHSRGIAVNARTTGRGALSMPTARGGGPC